MDSRVFARRELMRMEELRSKLARLREELMSELVRRALSNVFFISSIPGAARNTTNGMNSGMISCVVRLPTPKERGRIGSGAYYDLSGTAKVG